MDSTSTATTITITTAVLNIIFVAILVAITGYYAKKTRDMAVEMEVARKAQLLPKLVLTLGSITSRHSSANLLNVGVGPAFNVDIKLEFGETDVRRWTAVLFVPNEKREFFFPDVPPGGMPDTQRAAETFRTVRAIGSYADMFGAQYSIDETIDLVEYWDMITAAHVRYQYDNLGEIRQKLNDVVSALRDIAGNVSK